MTIPYGMLIQWSNVDQAFLVTFPELTGETPQTHGDTHEEAARNGQEAMEGLITTFQSRQMTLPPPSLSLYSETTEWVDRTPATAS